MKPGGHYETIASMDCICVVRGAAGRLRRCAAAVGHGCGGISKPVPFPAGGPSDVLARMIGQRMSEDWSQPVLIENRVGANTVIGAQAVQKASADGYTLLMAIDSTLTMNQYLYRSLPYDPFNDFVPITLVAKTMMFMFVNAASDIKTVKDLVAKAKAQPGKLNFGAGTITSKLTGHLLNKALGIDTMLISYNGSAEVTQGLLTRSVDVAYSGRPIPRSCEIR
jgi:tripartite-type tricarboxylate transporter receptor subunit TctC